MLEKPSVVLMDDLAEGVFAASGCWSGFVVSSQDWNGNYHVFEIHLTHSKEVEHISTACTITLAFTGTVTDAYAENGGSCSIKNGSTVEVTRPSHANAYKSGDPVTYKVWAKSVDEATTKALSCSITSYECSKQTNVQGGGADGN
jgi:UDP-N-acetylmuramyl pentapeptide synthase